LDGLMKFRILSEDASRAYRLAEVEALPEVVEGSERPVLAQRRRPLESTVRVELRDVQLAQRAFGLTEIQASTRHRDREFNAHGRWARGTIRGTSGLQRPIGTPAAAFAVHEEGDLIIATGDAAIGAQLPQGEREIARGVRGDRGGLADNSDSPRTGHSRLRVLVGQSRVLVDEAGRHREMACHGVGVLLAQCLELVARGSCEVARGDLFGNLRSARPVVARTVVPRPLVSRTVPVRTITTRSAAPRTIPIGTIAAGSIPTRSSAPSAITRRTIPTRTIIPRPIPIRSTASSPLRPGSIPRR